MEMSKIIHIMDNILDGKLSFHEKLMYRVNLIYYGKLIHNGKPLRLWYKLQNTVIFHISTFSKI
jgi:hypothetical protein